MSFSISSTISISPQGEKFTLPSKDEFQNEFKRLRTLTDSARSQQKEVVVVLGSGFSTAVMAAIIADSKNSNGENSKFVIWCQNSTAQNYWKIPLLNKGLSPVKTTDPLVAELISSKVNHSQNLTATYNPDCLSLADCVIVDAQCDDPNNEPGELFSTEIQTNELKATMKAIGEKISPYCLVLVESAAAPGTTEFVAYPVLKNEFDIREIENEPLLAHSFRGIVTSEKDYVSNIRKFWRVCAGCNDNSRRRVQAFLKSIHPENHQVTVFERPIESETTMIIENSYKTTLLALYNEWNLFAERNGVNFSKVIEAIRRHPAHSNLFFTDSPPEG